MLKSKAFLKAASGKALDSAVAYCETARTASFSRPLVKDWRLSMFDTFSKMYEMASFTSDSFLFVLMCSSRINLSTAISLVAASTEGAASLDNDISKELWKA